MSLRQLVAEICHACAVCTRCGCVSRGLWYKRLRVVMELARRHLLCGVYAGLSPCAAGSRIPSCVSTTPVCPSAACFRSSTFHCLRETWYVIRGNGPRTYTTVGVFFIEQQCSVGTWDVPTLDLRHVLRATMCVCVCIHIYRHTNNPGPRSQPRARVPSSTRNCRFRARRL